jgi:hypothetical protein
MLEQFGVSSQPERELKIISVLLESGVSCPAGGNALELRDVAKQHVDSLVEVASRHSKSLEERIRLSRPDTRPASAT